MLNESSQHCRYPSQNFLKLGILKFKTLLQSKVRKDDRVVKIEKLIIIRYLFIFKFKDFMFNLRSMCVVCFKEDKQILKCSKNF